MLRTLMRSARARATVAAVTASLAVGLAIPASAGPREPDSSAPTSTPQPRNADGLGALLAHLSGSCETAMQVPARLLSAPIDLSTCDLRGTLVRAGALAVRVPQQPGEGAAASSLLTEQAPDNAVTELSVLNTGREVVVKVLRAGEKPHDKRASRSKRADTATTDACSAEAHAYIGTQNAAMRWSFNQASTPAYLSGEAAESAIAEGAHVISTGDNDCGLAELSAIEESYQGETSRRVNCAAPDGHNVIDFGPRPEHTLATTCWWYRTSQGVRQVYEADLRFQEEPGTFYSLEPLSCQDKFQLTGVAAHEFGHAFGLAHISEEKYPHLTMSHTAPPCSYAQASLGKGDWLGLRNLYGE